ncbi:hypothetical protein KJ751_01995 [Patescibacteria group bacterium]|nr:hypothetical protein [Patescibacteria group bacterium]
MKNEKKIKKLIKFMEEFMEEANRGGEETKCVLVIIPRPKPHPDSFIGKLEKLYFIKKNES